MGTSGQLQFANYPTLLWDGETCDKYWGLCETARRKLFASLTAYDRENFNHSNIQFKRSGVPKTSHEEQLHTKRNCKRQSWRGRQIRKIARRDFSERNLTHLKLDFIYNYSFTFCVNFFMDTWNCFLFVALFQINSFFETHFH